jgi:multicomponent Na+:H+ antiporter subunit F
MSAPAAGFLLTVAYLSQAVLSVALVVTLARLIKGPSLPDRVVALDLMAAIAVGMIATYSILTGESAILDVAVIVALITFISTLAFASFLERGGAQ